MEFIEYYRLLRRYFWVPLLLLVLGIIGGALVYFLGPATWRASGQMLAQAGAAYRIRWAGAEVELVEEQEVWGTLEQLVHSQAVLERAAGAAGLRDGKGSDKLVPLAFQRDKRGNIFRLIATAGTPEAARLLADKAMTAVADLWDEQRLQRAETIGREIRQRLTSLTPERDRVLADMRRLEAGPTSGPPTEVLTATQTQISELDGAIGTGTVDVGAARDRLRALAGMSQGERGAQPDQPANVALVAVQARLADLQAQRRRMLQARTELHPDVIVLDDEIAAAQREVVRARAQATGPGRPPSTLDQQIVLARADVQAAQRRLAELQSRQSQLKAALASLRARATAYKQLQDQLAPLDDERETLLGNLKTVNNEVARLRDSRDLSVVDPAAVTDTNRNPARLVTTVVAAGIAGFVLGILLVFVLHYVQLVGNGRPPEVAPPSAAA